ncbi:MAG: hypothetical protein PVG39_02370 [Desulfobacteraceae bacterium]|jgi:hypothetical protein
MKKQNLGQFNTKNDVWLRPHIKEFILDSGCDVLVDPYAGEGDLLNALSGHFKSYIGYDIDPSMGWSINDGLVDVPRHDSAIVVTNPPYLAKNSATRNNFESYKYFEDNTMYEDLYQIALCKVLDIYKKAVFIIPETYFQANIFRSYLDLYTVIEDNPFVDTDCPVCVAAFTVNNDFFKLAGNNFKIYKNAKFLFDSNTLEDIMLNLNTNWCSPRYPLVFNDVDGNLGLRGIDGIGSMDKIKFCKPEELDYNLDGVGETSRSITVINVKNVDVNEEFISRANYLLNKLRKETHDIIFSPFKNNNKLGHRRRRLDFRLARKIIEKTIETLTN